MCSRFEINARPRDLARRFGLATEPAGYAIGEVRPTNEVLTITGDGSRPMPWGLKVDWDTKPLINARAETLTEKQTFRPLLENRCLVPAEAYFEWRKDGKARLKNRIHPAAGGIFAFAGLHDGERAVIVTCAPAPDIAHIHGRMPVILSQADEMRWCDPKLTFADVAALLHPTAPGALAADEDTPPQPKQRDLFGGSGT